VLKRTCYLTLGCRITEHDNGIRHAFHTLVKHYHPDSVGANGTPFFQEIVEAYRGLSDSGRRANYARGLSHAGAVTNSQVALPLLAFDSGLNMALRTVAPFIRRPRIDWLSLDLVRERVLGNFLRALAPRQMRTEPIDAQLMLTPEDAASGGVAMIDAPAYYPCALCRGSGREDGSPCSDCDQTGLVEERETIAVAIPTMLESHRQVEIPLRGLGIHNYYLRLHFNLMPQ
jgi:molecular chaperone DnaJ/curved DNA-binding protein